MRPLLSVSVAFLIAIISALIYNRTDRPIEYYSLQKEDVNDRDKATATFARILAVPTVSKEDNTTTNTAAFQQIHKTLNELYPLAFSALKHERINEHSLLMHWEGSEKDLNPIIIISHLDVVPAPPQNWTHPPFSGTIHDGYIYGRGSLDTKITMCAALEAISQLLKANFVPKRTLILAFGHDEETGGFNGAQAIAKTLASRGIQAELLLDEGGMVLADGIKPIYSKPVAVVGLAEKGVQSWSIHVTGTGGHSSIPPTGLGTSTSARMARILSRIENELTPTRISPTVMDFLYTLSTIAENSVVRFVLSFAKNPFVSPLLGQLMGQYGEGSIAALVRTTVAVVGIHVGGVATNVLPSYGNITLNFRTLPGDGREFIGSYLNNLIINKEGKYASAKIIESRELPAPSTIARPTGRLWNLLVQSIQESLTPYEEGKENILPIVPFLFTGRTDSCWFEEIAGGRIFRFSPMKVNRGAGDLDRIHGTDERVSIEDYLDAVGFFMKFCRLGLAGDEFNAGK